MNHQFVIELNRQSDRWILRWIEHALDDGEVLHQQVSLRFGRQSSHALSNTQLDRCHQLRRGFLYLNKQQILSELWYSNDIYSNDTLERLNIMSNDMLNIMGHDTLKRLDINRHDMLKRLNIMTWYTKEVGYFWTWYARETEYHEEWYAKETDYHDMIHKRGWISWGMIH